jgi:hypothetical protein
MAFVQVNDVDYKLETPGLAPIGLVSVDGLPISTEAIQTEIARITRLEWGWEALPHGEKSFLVAFPNVETLCSMVDIGYQLKNHGVTITVSEWQINQDIVLAYELDEVWVHITNVHISTSIFWFFGLWAKK